MRPEHQFSKYNAREWETVVIANANYYKVVRFLGSGNWDRREYRDKAEAIMDARSDPRALLYAITASGRHALISRKEYA